NDSRVEEFTIAGSFIRQWGVFAATGVATLSSGNVLVVSPNNNLVYEYDANGNFVTAMGGGQLSVPYFAGANASTGNIYVSDSGNNRIAEFDSSGSFLGSIGSGQFALPFGVAVDSSGN